MSPSKTKRVVPLIEAKLSQFTPSEKKIADFFLTQSTKKKAEHFSAKLVSKKLGVSEASLTRFAQKCGFRGYRELVYGFCLPDEVSIANFSQPVLSSYQDLLNKTYHLIDVTRIRWITRLLLEKKRVFIYGKGSSGMVAQEMKLRFMRIGLVCEAITDDDMIRMNEVIVNKDSLVIGITISGQTKIIIESLYAAKAQQAATVLFTANADPEFVEQFDIVQLFAVKNNLEHGRMISPQFPILIVLDMLYADYMNTDKKKRDKIWQQTYNALQKNKE